MADSHYIIEHLLEEHFNTNITLPEATLRFVTSMMQRANAVPPDLTLTEATVLEVLWKTYMQRR